MDWKQIGPYIVPLIVVALIARRLFRAQQARRIRPMALWIGPIIVLLGMAAVFATSPMPTPSAMALFVVGAVAGGVVGYLRALHQEFSIDPETGNVMSKATPLGSILFLGIFVIRFGMNYWMRGGMTPDMAHAPNPQVILYTDITLFFAFAMVTASAFEVYRRTRPLIVEHKATQALPPAP
jgi:Kef-type K+ transport system membrane component KefB